MKEIDYVQIFYIVRNFKLSLMITYIPHIITSSLEYINIKKGDELAQEGSVSNGTTLSTILTLCSCLSNPCRNDHAARWSWIQKTGMFVKTIVVDGFKSYGQRVQIDGFDPAFNAITGLNGSGKSNILDAICFLMGISNLSHVRAENLQVKRTLLS